MALEDQTLSTTIDTEPGPSAAGGGTPNLSEPVEPPKEAPVSAREDIEAAFKEDAAKAEAEKPEPEKGKAKEEAEPAKDAKPAKDEAKPETEEKPAAEEGKEPADKAQDAEKAGEEAKADDKLTKHAEPPKNFLPDSKEVWRNVPRAVRRDIETMTREHETEVTQLREATERYEAIKPFDDLARSNGRDLRESLHKVVEIENALAANPIAGLNRILMEVGPRKADGQPFSLYEVADFITKQGPQGYQQIVTQQPQQEQGPSEAEQLRAEVEALKAEMTVRPIIDRFASRNPRYHELQNDVALFLQSGKIPASLSPEDRLAAAYDMAVRVNPPSMSDKTAASTEGEDGDRRADEGFSGSKSIKSSPGAVTEEVEDQAPSGESVGDSLRKEMRRLNRA